jgi:hypothetical protein
VLWGEWCTRPCCCSCAAAESHTVMVLSNVQATRYSRSCQHPMKMYTDALQLWYCSYAIITLSLHMFNSWQLILLSSQS